MIKLNIIQHLKHTMTSVEITQADLLIQTFDMTELIKVK